ncbi:hypothetical protein ACS0TY_023518 [Phlomoides rotata]
MAVDPYEEDVPDAFTDVNDGNGGEDGFIDQVELSLALTTFLWLSLIISGGYKGMDNMNVNNELNIGGGRGRQKAAPNIRRVWTYIEERGLVNALKELVVKGHKCDNGFKTGYLMLLENMLANKFPGTNLKGDPHINSKIHTMLGNSGIGLNNTTYRIDAMPEVDPIARTLKNNVFPFYADWCEIFGNDRANGMDSQFYSDTVNEMNTQTTKKRGSSCGGDQAGEIPLTNDFSGAEFSSFNVGESSSATKDKDKTSKRRQVDELQVQFIDTIGALCDKNHDKFGAIADTMGNIAQRIGSEFEACKKRGLVYDQLETFELLSVEARVEVAQYLCNNSKDMDLFLSLPELLKLFLSNVS